MYDSPFSPNGPTYLVNSQGPVQILAYNNSSYSSIRLVNTAGTVTRVSWAPPNGGNAPQNMNPSAPTTTSPVMPNVITLAANGIAVLGLPNGSWLIASQVSIEATPGEGIN